jgi:hypothetical protein
LLIDIFFDNIFMEANMRKIIILSVALLANTALFADPFEDFKTNISKDLLKPFAEDFGGVIGGNDFNSGRALGFPGFDVSLGLTLQSKPSTDNKVLKQAGVDAFGIGMVNASIAVPLTGADLMVRGFSYSGLSIIGGGLRYNIFKSGTLTKFMPDLSVLFFYDSINYDYFKGNHISGDLVASLDFPLIKPYAGIGIDRTKLEIKGVSAALNGIDDPISKMRYTVGAKVTILPFVYLYGAYNSMHGQDGYSGGLGVRF